MQKTNFLKATPELEDYAANANETVDGVFMFINQGAQVIDTARYEYTDKSNEELGDSTDMTMFSFEIYTYTGDEAPYCNFSELQADATDLKHYKLTETRFVSGAYTDYVQALSEILTELDVSVVELDESL